MKEQNKKQKKWKKNTHSMFVHNFDKCQSIWIEYLINILPYSCVQITEKTVSHLSHVQIVFENSNFHWSVIYDTGKTLQYWSMLMVVFVVYQSVIRSCSHDVMLDSSSDTVSDSVEVDFTRQRKITYSDYVGLWSTMLHLGAVKVSSSVLCRLPRVGSGAVRIGPTPVPDRR